MDGLTRLKVMKFAERDTTAALLSIIADYITPQRLSINRVRTDNGGDFEGDSQSVLDRRNITHECIPPDTLGLSREKAIAAPQEKS